MWHLNAASHSIYIRDTFKSMGGNDRNARVKFQAQNFKLEAWRWNLELHINSQVIHCGGAFHELHEGGMIWQFGVLELTFKRKDNVFRRNWLAI